MRRLKWTVLLWAFLIVVPAALAQMGPPPDGGPGDGPDGPIDPRLQRRLKMFWMWRMVDEVDITEDQAAKLFPIVQKYEDQVRDARRTQGDGMRKIAEAARKQQWMSKDEILAIQDEAIQADVEIHKLRRKQLEEVSTLLTDEQFQRFVVAQFNFQRELREMVRQARGGRGRRGGPPPDAPPDSPPGADMP